MDKKTMAQMIDHTLLKPQATTDQIRQLCSEAAQYHFWSVCVNSGYVPLAAACLRDTGVKVCTVVGFPLGASSGAAKAFEARKAIEDGASEVDMVVNVGRIKSGDWDFVKSDIESVVAAAKDTHTNTLVKVIIEACLLSDDEKVQTCRIAKEAGADFVKTSTGFSTGGATVHDVALMRQTVGPEMGVKASGGIHTAEEALALVKAGASRIGASAGIQILQGMKD